MAAWTTADVREESYNDFGFPCQVKMSPKELSPVTDSRSKKRRRSKTRSPNRIETTQQHAHTRSDSQKKVCSDAKRSSTSTIRRYFLFLVFLDLVIHILGYLLYLQHARDFNLADLFGCQMKCYDIETSLVDVLMLAVARFLLLEFAYGLGRSNSWIGATLTTAITSVFVIVKSLHYDWESECQRLLPVSLIVLSFVLPWLEAFLVDFKLIEMEKLAHAHASVPPEVLPKAGLFPITRNLFRSDAVPQ